MVASSWLTAALVAAGLLLAADGAMAKMPGFRVPANPTYGNLEGCPERCSVTGASTGNWSVYASLKQVSRCKQTMFYGFSLYDPIDDPTINHRIQACSSFGPDFAEIPSSSAKIASAGPTDVRFEVGWWQEGFGLAAPGIRSLIRQIRKYIDHGHGETDRPFVMFGQSGQATIGIYIGQGLLNQGISESALRILHDNLANLNASTPSLAMQLCGPGYDSTHTFGVIATSNGTFTPIQDAIKTWANATCLSFAGSASFPGQVAFTKPLLSTNGTVPANSTILAKTGLHARATCKTVQVVSGDSCTSLATRCGISGFSFDQYNPGICSSLKPGQHVCCSSGTLPDFRPKPNADGSCYSYQVKADDNCASLAAANGLTLEDIEEFNQNTWGWSGCKILFLDTIMCLSSGSPPFPAPIGNAKCGPQMLGSKPPTDGSKIADLNPCPLNACCNIWGQCGLTKDFCIDTNTGPPGTAAPGTYGCISNCGLDVVRGDGTGAIKIGYFEGYGLSRECLFQSATQIDTSRYTHIHFAFGLLTDTYEVNVGDVLSTYQFGRFKTLTGVKRILSFGGWTFSTDPTTYHIFRNGVKPANRLKMATNIANFVKEHGLDGVDIDWEYPGAPDIPIIPPADEDEGLNYLAFLAILRNLLRDKSVSIAAPSSYWYLKQYPIKEISRIVDYVVYMTYDLHGQWDVDNLWSQEGCSDGNCLRSQVNLTETRLSLAMITKAGVPGSKVVVGVTSYGRSFEMAQAGCWGPDCRFTGTRLISNAKKGVCTGTSGYIADAEIAEIMQTPERVVKSYLDTSSNSDILVYDNNQWVGYMSSATKNVRTFLYTAWGLGGTTDWATDLQKYNPAPYPQDDWLTYKMIGLAGGNPDTDDTRTGGWTDFNCTHIVTRHPQDYTPSERWKAVNADAAWLDIVRIWKVTDSKRPGGGNFMTTVTDVLDMRGQTHCELIQGCSCDAFGDCPKSADGDFSGPAAEFIYNSLVRIHQVHHEYYEALGMAAGSIALQVKDLENKFAPVPEPEDKAWTYLLIDLITLGTLSIAGPAFNSVVKNLPYFRQHDTAADNLKDTFMTLTGQSTTIAKDVLPTKIGEWTPAHQDAFSSYINRVIDGSKLVTELALAKLFSGTDEALDLLWNLMSDGKFIEGKWEADDGSASTARNMSQAVLNDHVARSLFAYSIPLLWRVSNTFAFVMDSGLGCNDDKKALSEYLDEATMTATGACVDGRQYYLVHPGGDYGGDCYCRKYEGQGHNCVDLVCVDKFSMPPGLDSLVGEQFAGITRQQLVEGSIRTWIQNGRKNGGGSVDVTNGATVDSLSSGDITAPGYIRIPVCSPERALQSWETTNKGSSANYPCDIPPGRNLCGVSTFVDQTSAVSPKVEDCLQVIRNIEGNGGWQHEQITGGWLQTAIGDSHDSCRFGVEATGSTTPNAVFWIGGQDVIDIINEAIKKFGGSGRVSAYGEMACNGNIQHQSMKWGIY